MSFDSFAQVVTLKREKLKTPIVIFLIGYFIFFYQKVFEIFHDFVYTEIIN
jgi:hypothetical protein